MERLNYKDLFENNKKWIEEKENLDPNYFTKLSAKQTPKYLIIGCSDSRIPLTRLVKAEPGEIFIHRNIANQVRLTDMNFLSVLEYSVEVLKIKHIIVTGHYDCGGIAAAVDGVDQGMIENWIAPIKDLYKSNKEELDAFPTKREMTDRLSEINVMAQAEKILKTPVMMRAFEREQKIKVYAWIFNIYNGEIIEQKLPIKEWKKAGLLPNYYPEN